MNSPTILNEDQVQDFIDYITQKNDVGFDSLKYIAYEWHINSTQRDTLQSFRKVLNVTDTNQAILFLLCSSGLGEIKNGMKKVLVRDNVSLRSYFEIIELILFYSKGFQFDEYEIATIIDKATKLLESETNSEIRVSCVTSLFSWFYFESRLRCFVSMKYYLRDYLKLDILSITNLVVLCDYYQAAYVFLRHFVETDSDEIEIRDLLINATRQKMDNLSKDFFKLIRPYRDAKRQPSKKKICFLSHITSLYTPYANTRAFYSFLKGLHSSSADQFDFYWYTLGTAEDETIEELESMGVKVRRFDKITDVQERAVHLLNSFNNDEIDVVVNDYPNFWVIFLYSIRVAPVQIYFCLGFVYFEFEGVDYLLLSKEEKLNDKIKTDIIDCESNNWLESRFLEGLNSKDEVRSNLGTTFYSAVKQLAPQAKYIIGCYGRFEKINEEYLSVIKTILHRKEDIIFFVFGPGDQLLATDYFTRNGLQDRVIISGTSDPHVLGWAFDVFCEQWPIWSGQSSLEVMAKGIPVVSYMYEDLSLFIEPYLSLRDSQLVAKSHQEYIDTVIRLLEDKEYYAIKQNSVKKVSKKVTNLAERAKDVGRQILLALERTPKSESTWQEQI